MAVRDAAFALTRRVLGSSGTTGLHARLWERRLRRGITSVEDLVDRYLEAGDIAIDIGAHGGSWTHPMAVRVGRHGRVFAFEALPYYVQVLGKTLSRMGVTNTEISNVALLDVASSVELAVLDRRGRRLTGRTHILGRDDPDVGATERVEAVPLDSLIESTPRLTQARLVKCDVEGTELFVFRGARNFLAEAQPVIVCEIEDTYCRRYGHRASDVFGFFGELGYRWQRLSDGDYLLMPARKADSGSR